MERQSTFAKVGDYRAVRGPERESLLYLMVSTCCRKRADFSTGVNQVAGKVFPDIEQGCFCIW